MYLKLKTNDEIKLTPSIFNEHVGNVVEFNISNRDAERLFYDIWEEFGSDGIKKWIEAEGCVFVDNAE